MDEAEIGREIVGVQGGKNRRRADPISGRFTTCGNPIPYYCGCPAWTLSVEIRADAANNRIIADLYRGIAVNKTSATQAELSQFLVELKATPYDLHTHVLLRAADHALASYSVILSSWVEAKLRLASEYARTDLRPPWSDNRGKRKQSCLEFDKMDGWTQTNVVRCLANCYKHNSGCCRKDDGRVLGMSEGEGIDYLACQDASGAWRARDWDGYTEGVTSFLNAVVAGLPSLKTASLSEA